MQESSHVRDWIDLTGLVGLVVFLYVATELHEPLLDLLDNGGRAITPLGWIMIVTAPAGWGGLVYACVIRPDRITATALVFVLALGFFGGAISFFALYRSPPDYRLMVIVFLTGTWIMNGLGIVWIVQKVRRIRAASNTDAADAAR